MKNGLRAAVRVSLSSALPAACAAALAMAVGGGGQEPSPFNPRLMQEWERAHAPEGTRRPLYPLPATQESRYNPGETDPRPLPLEQQQHRNVPDGPPVAMTLQE